MTREAVIVSACRTPIGDFLGSLKSVPARELAGVAGKAAIARAGIDAGLIDEIIVGLVYGAGQGSNVSRMIGMDCGLPVRSGAMLVNQNCSSSMRAFEIASHNIMLGKTDIALVVGCESMTNAPYLVPRGRTGYRLGPGKLEDAILHDGLVCTLAGGHMGITAENVAAKYNITRQEQDELAVLSHQRAAAASASGKLQDEIVPVEVKSRKSVTVFDTDEHPRAETSLESLGRLRPAFKKDGTVTAGNASGINDASCAVVLMSRDKAQEMGITPLAKVVTTCVEGVAPEVMGLGPAVAIPRALQQANLKWDDVDYWEINEAFAAQWLGVGRMLKEEQGIEIDMEKCNRNGSGISLCHPVGCTGLRIIVSCLYELIRMDKILGGASLCVGGGPAMATIISRDV